MTLSLGVTRHGDRWEVQSIPWSHKKGIPLRKEANEKKAQDQVNLNEYFYLKGGRKKEQCEEEREGPSLGSEKAKSSKR